MKIIQVEESEFRELLRIEAKNAFKEAMSELNANQESDIWLRAAEVVARYKVSPSTLKKYRKLEKLTERLDYQWCKRSETDKVGLVKYNPKSMAERFERRDSKIHPLKSA